MCSSDLKWWTKAPSSQHHDGECRWEHSCPLVFLKQNAQMREWWTRCAWPRIGEPLPKMSGTIQDGDRGEYSGHGNRTKHKGDLCARF